MKTDASRNFMLVAERLSAIGAAIADVLAKPALKAMKSLNRMIITIRASK